MTRSEAIPKIVWALLAHPNEPGAAVAAARTLCPSLGARAELDFRNLLRSAGVFAYDDDGFFLRYASTDIAGSNALLAAPAPTHLLTTPVPVEPRMRIAYSVLAGLFLKYLYQQHGAVPLEVAEGVSILWAPENPIPRSPLPTDVAQIWKGFQLSAIVGEALHDGIEAALSAVGNIGAVAVTSSMAGPSSMSALLAVLAEHEGAFQAQGGMRMDFYVKSDLGHQEHLAEPGETIQEVWTAALRGEMDSDTASPKIVGLLLRGCQNPMTFRAVSGLWNGEGAGQARKKGIRDDLGWRPKSEWKDSSHPQKATEIDEAVRTVLRRLERCRQGTRGLDRWVCKEVSGIAAYQEMLDSVVAGIRDGGSDGVDAKTVLEELVVRWEDKLLVSRVNKKEIPAAIEKTLENLLAWELSRRVNSDDVAVFGWPASTLRTVPEDLRFALRFTKKTTPPASQRILEVRPFGSLVRFVEDTASTPSPFVLEALNRRTSARVCGLEVPSDGRCIVCGSSGELIGGAKSFLPESKKRWYESPGSLGEPKLCGTCAFVAYLSSIYPSEDKSVLEFPADNFLELFAVHERLQGISGLVALKAINRVNTLSVLPNRYLLLTKSDKQGRMDSKTQIYAQLRNHIELLKDLGRPMRVQIEGAQPNVWSEIHPHVAIGLSHFSNFPEPFETGDRKILAQNATMALTEGQPFKATYLVAQARQPERGFGREKDVLARGVRRYESEFVRNRAYAAKLARALGGGSMDCSLYGDAIDFSNFLLDVVRPLVQREIGESGSAVAGVARKYTELISRDFAECRSARFLYRVSQEADALEGKGEGWAKWRCLEKLYGSRPILKDKSGEEAAEVWAEFRNQHPKTLLEEKIEELHEKYGTDAVIWSKFLSEVQCRTLALLMLNVSAR